jgi:hypothetical protein
MFATAITGAIDMQQQVSNVLNSTAAQTSNTAASVTGNISDLVDSTGDNMGDLGSPLAAAMNYFQDTGAAGTASFTAVEDAANFAKNHGITDLNSFMINEIIPTFQAWGITSVPQVNNAFEQLLATVGNGNFAPSDLLTMMASAQPLSQAGANFGDTINEIQSLSKQMPNSDVETFFKGFVNGAGNALDPFNTLVLGIQDGVKKLIKDDGGNLETLINTAQSNISNMSETQRQQVVGSNTLNQQTVQALATMNTDKLAVNEMEVKKLTVDATTASTQPQPKINADLTGTESFSRQMTDAWNKLWKDLTLDLVNAFTQDVVTPIKDFGDLITGKTNVAGFLKDLSGLFNGGILSGATGGIANGLDSTLANALTKVFGSSSNSNVVNNTTNMSIGSSAISSKAGATSTSQMLEKLAMNMFGL